MANHSKLELYFTGDKPNVVLEFERSASETISSINRALEGRTHWYTVTNPDGSVTSFNLDHVRYLQVDDVFGAYPNA